MNTSTVDPFHPPYEQGLTTYRAFRLDGRGNILSAEVIPAFSDDEAIGKVRILTNGHGIDLWERARHLGTFPPLRVA